MSETLSEQVLRVIADFEWIGTQRRLGEMWAMDIAALEAERDELKAKLEAMRNAAAIAIVALAHYSTSDNELDNVREMLEGQLLPPRRRNDRTRLRR